MRPSHTFSRAGRQAVSKLHSDSRVSNVGVEDQNNILLFSLELDFGSEAKLLHSEFRFDGQF